MKYLDKYKDMTPEQIWDSIYENVETISNREWNEALMIMYNKGNGPKG